MGCIINYLKKKIGTRGGGKGGVGKGSKYAMHNLNGPQGVVHIYNFDFRDITPELGK